MRIGIDVRYLSHDLLGGVHTYVAQMVPALIELTGAHQLFLYADTKRPFELHDLPAHVTVRYLPWRSALSSVYHDLFMHRQMAHDRLDVVHYPANYGFGPRGTRTVITLHDALNILPLRRSMRGLGDTRSARTLAMISYLHYCTSLAVRRAHLLITDSRHARREIMQHSRVDPARIVAVPLAPAPDMRRVVDPQQLAEVRQRYELERPFVLCDAIKNPDAVVRAWRLLPAALRESRQIVFFARRADLLPIVHEAVAAGEARLLLRPSYAELMALYSQAEAFVFPSWIEGFGLPVLEAMRCGAPVIASARGSIPEVVGDAALLIDPEQPAALAEQLARLLGSPELARQLQTRGLARAAQFSWRATAQRTLESYQQALSA